ncbi:uncharacterized protein [Rutidosis leptorrhynchoides]|uniref:uncharacterized protein isoform X2 n=1 Tax=Rutidosis leptorrhynchoides TaxID=125765 RepID=UPI003A998A4E
MVYGLWLQNCQLTFLAPRHLYFRYKFEGLDLGKLGEASDFGLLCWSNHELFELEVLEHFMRKVALGYNGLCNGMDWWTLSGSEIIRLFVQKSTGRVRVPTSICK